MWVGAAAGLTGGSITIGCDSSNCCRSCASLIIPISAAKSLSKDACKLSMANTETNFVDVCKQMSGNEAEKRVSTHANTDRYSKMGVDTDAHAYTYTHTTPHTATNQRHFRLVRKIDAKQRCQLSCATDKQCPRQLTYLTCSRHAEVGIQLIGFVA